MLRHPGFIIRPGKCNLIPSTTFVYLENVWNTNLWTVGVKEKRETSIRSLASVILGSDAVGVRRFSRLLGKIRSTADAFSLARARGRALAFDFFLLYVRNQKITMTCFHLQRKQGRNWNIGKVFQLGRALGFHL